MKDKVIRMALAIYVILFIAISGCVPNYVHTDQENERKINNVNSFTGTYNEAVYNYNYEYTSRQYNNEIRRSHFRIHIEIEKPYIIKTAELKNIPKIYRIAGLNGSSLFKAKVNENGEVESYEIAISEGLGFDELAEEILKKIKFSPSYQAGKSSKSYVYIKISIRVDDRI